MAAEQDFRGKHRPRLQQGFTVFFTGLPGSGKSTIANVLFSRLLKMGGRPVIVLDGDVIRRHLSEDLGFSKEHRDTNIRRIGFVASMITQSGAIALCAQIAPYHSARRQVRQMIEATGGFILVHIATPLEVCEERDPKGLYLKARAGLVEHFTGVSDPYEPPSDAEIVIDTTGLAPDEAAHTIVDYLQVQGYVNG